MLENFSHQAIQLIEDAKVWAKKMDSVLVGSEHLLLAMYHLSDSICRFLLQDRKIEEEDLYNVITKSVILRKQEHEDIIFTKKFQEIILNAKDIALEMHSEYVFDEHIFYSLLKDESSVAKDVLVRLGLDIKELIEDIEDIFGFENQPIHPFPFLTNLSTISKPHEYVKRSNHLERIKTIMSKKQKNNPMLIGNAGVGKTAIIEGLALELKNETIYRLDLGAIISGTKYRGELEEKIIKAMEFIKEHKAILFIDEIHNIVGAGSNEGSLDIANILKPYLARSDIKCIGATTLDEYYRFIEKDKALLRRFQNIFVDEPTTEETKVILNGIKHYYEDYHKIKYEDEHIDQIIAGCVAFLPSRTFPDKAIDVLDEVGARYKAGEKDIPTVIDNVIRDMSGISGISVDNLRKCLLNYEELRPYYLRFLEGLNSGSNIACVQVDRSFNIELLKQDLYQVFHFKNEMYLEINLENYHDPSMINNLIGSSKGYIGYESGGLISEHIIKYPLSLIYFHKMDLAHLQVQAFIKKIMQSSFIIDNKGRTVNLRNVIFIYDLHYEKVHTIGLIREEKVVEKPLYDVYIKNSDKKKNQGNSNIINKPKFLKIMKKYKLNIEFLDHPNSEIELEKLLSELILCGEGSYQIYYDKGKLSYRKKETA